jgi:transcription elongation factor GreB
MSKAFTKEDGNDEPPVFHSRFPILPANFRNLITTNGRTQLEAELTILQAKHRAATVDEAKRLKLEIEDLSGRLATQEIVPPLDAVPDKVMFGTTVKILGDDGVQRIYAIVGTDEADAEVGRISWTSPLARALLHQPVGGVVTVRTPNGDNEVEIIAICLPHPAKTHSKI